MGDVMNRQTAEQVSKLLRGLHRSIVRALREPPGASDPPKAYPIVFLRPRELASRPDLGERGAAWLAHQSGDWESWVQIPPLRPILQRLSSKSENTKRE